MSRRINRYTCRGNPTTPKRPAVDAAALAEVVANNPHDAAAITFGQLLKLPAGVDLPAYWKFLEMAGVDAQVIERVRVAMVPRVQYEGGCGHAIITVDVDRGVTPMFIECPLCKVMMHSALYRVEAGLTPTREWYRPGLAETESLEAGARQHVEAGGLLLRDLGTRWTN